VSDPRGSLVPFNFTYSPGTSTVRLKPAKALDPGTTYTAIIMSGPNGVKDQAGNAMAADFTWSFTTVARHQGGPPPRVVSVSPGDGNTNVASTAKVFVEFSNDMDPTTINESTITLQGQGPKGATIPYRVTYGHETTSAIIETIGLLPSTTYTVTVQGGPNGVLDEDGNSLVGDRIVRFTTQGPQTVGLQSLAVSSPTTMTGGAASTTDGAADLANSAPPAAAAASPPINPGATPPNPVGSVNTMDIMADSGNTVQPAALSSVLGNPPDPNVPTGAATIDAGSVPQPSGASIPDSSTRSTAMIIETTNSAGNVWAGPPTQSFSSAGGGFDRQSPWTKAADIMATSQIFTIVFNPSEDDAQAEPQWQRDKKSRQR
jgi:Bacterial Ig-like domain